MPTTDGLTLRSLRESDQKPQILPGSRELGAFCGASGRAVLIRHWPDYRRSIELVVPGQAPQQVHLGDQAVLGVACDNRGKRIWAVLGRWEQQRGNHELVLINAAGEISQRICAGHHDCILEQQPRAPHGPVLGEAIDLI